MLLYLIRHAWAEERDDARWPNDDLRPLTDEGWKRFRKQLKQIPAKMFSPQLIATSPLLRCVQTAEIVARHFDLESAAEQLPALALGSDLAAATQWTAAQSAERIAWCGHAPDVSHLAAGLIGTGSAAIDFPKGAIAAIEFDGPPTAGGGTLLWLASAKLWGV